jgi:hypothetical protein
VSLILILIGVGLILRGWFAFDTLLRHQYKSHRASWEQDGQPTGYFFVPEGTLDWKHVFLGSPRGPTLHNKRAGARIQHRWLLDTPEWAKTDSRALQLLFQYRALTVTGLIACALPLLELLYYWNG